MITNTNTYLKQIQQQFPQVSEQDIKKIVNYGWRMFYFYNLQGCDTLITSTTNKYWFYCGQLTKNSIKHYNYYKFMMRKKLRAVFKMNKLEWDGYYYVGITIDEYNSLFSNKLGRKKCNLTLTNRVYFKLEDEAKLYYDRCKYIIRFKNKHKCSFSFYKDKLLCRNIEIYITRERPCKFKDILLTENNYTII